MAILSTDKLTYTYSTCTPFEKTAVDHVDLEIEEGTFVGVIGSTGSGKSTLMQHFNGLLRPTSGSVYLDGQDIWADKNRLRDIRFQVGLVFQYPEYQLFEETVYRDIAFGPANMGLSESEINERVLEAAEFAGLTESQLSQSPFALSGGQKRRAAIAGVMAMRPRILILDEPTAGLDPMGREEILAEIHNYHKKTGCTILFVTHSMEDVSRYAEKLLVMNKGSIFCYDDTGAVFRQAEKIEKIGLAVPQVSRICNELRQRGIPLDDNIYTVKEAVKQLSAYYKSVKGGAASC